MAQKRRQGANTTDEPSKARSSRPGRTVREREPVRRPEDGIKQAIFEWLSVAGLPCAITDASRVWGPDGEVRPSKVTEGWSDVTAVGLDGRAVLIEVKTEDGDLRAGQRDTLERAHTYGAIAIVARSLEDVVERLEHEYRMYRDVSPDEDEPGWRLWRAIRAYRRGMGAR
jgi:hypothetical protein